MEERKDATPPTPPTPQEGDERRRSPVPEGRDLGGLSGKKGSQRVVPRRSALENGPDEAADGTARSGENGHSSSGAPEKPTNVKELLRSIRRLLPRRIRDPPRDDPQLEVQVRPGESGSAQGVSLAGVSTGEGPSAVPVPVVVPQRGLRQEVVSTGGPTQQQYVVDTNLPPPPPHAGGVAPFIMCPVVPSVPVVPLYPMLVPYSSGAPAPLPAPAPPPIHVPPPVHVPVPVPVPAPAPAPPPAPAQPHQQLQQPPVQTHFYVPSYIPPTQREPLPRRPPVAKRAQRFCCVLGCTRLKCKRDRKSMRLSRREDFKQEYLRRGWTNICNYHYFSQLYLYKKRTGQVVSNPEKKLD